ncbi:MAG: hypothetical protein GY947_00310 [Rhodobacteraceae bacterium]|nr:hypothetical protein [Paracoccaceae bacterium]
MESTLRHAAPTDLEVIETLRFDPSEGFVRLGLHLDRAAQTCARLGFLFDRGACLMKLGEAVSDSVARVRMTVNQPGEVAVKAAPLGASKPVWRVGLAAARLQSDDPWLQVKTTRRAVYDTARAGLPEGLDEWVFLNQQDEVCEGTITNVFVEHGGVLLTPPVSCGLLPGVLRLELLETGQAMESVLRVADLQAGEKVYVGNSLRGLIAADLIE